MCAFCVTVRATENVTALYGELIVIPCNNRIPPPGDMMFTKWKYVCRFFYFLHEKNKLGEQRFNNLGTWEILKKSF